jgi:antitoxin (DNA-binding transcriptional repressor) of toxin-antitoxin stability system
MLTVGIRELKNRLSEFIRAVTAGENVLVTDRGEVVAELAAPGRNAIDPGVPPGLAALARRGLVTLGAGQGDASALYRPLPRRRRARHSARDLLEQERGAR